MVEDRKSEYNSPLDDATLVICPHCDVLQHVPAVGVATVAKCVYCGEQLRKPRIDSAQRTLALSIAAALLFIVANWVPLLSLSVVGRESSTTVLGAVVHLWNDDRVSVAILVLITAFVAPLLQIGGMLMVSFAALTPSVPRWARIPLRYISSMRTWSMIEVMLLGVMVALIKIADYATVIPGLALFTLGGLIVLFAAMQAGFDVDDLWSRIEWTSDAERMSSFAIHDEAPANSAFITASQLGIQRCETCGLPSRPRAGADHGLCPRCGREVIFRKTDSVQRTWAFLSAAAVCYVPANVLPVLSTSTAAGTDTDTILQGVAELWSPTGWPLSLIVLFASIMIPSAKIVAMGYLLISVQRGSVKNNEERIRLFRTVEFIGRWSMVDVFVDTFTASLVQFEPLMSVEPGPGLFFFAAVVVMTMLAVESFDPRLIWDSSVNPHLSIARGIPIAGAS